MLRSRTRALRTACAIGAAATMLAACAGTTRTASATSHNAAVTSTSCGSSCGGPPRVVTLSTGPGPAKKYDCIFNAATSAYTGAFGTASAIGWEGNPQGVVTCLGGTFLAQDGLYKNFGFGIYNGTTTSWTDADGYLPAQITSFDSSGAHITITEFADQLTIDSHSYVAVYSRVAVDNETDNTVKANPEPTAGMVLLDTAPNDVKPHTSVAHDYVVAVDREGGTPWPTPEQLARAGGFNKHFSHMRAFWNAQLNGIAQVSVPDASLDDAYKSGFIYTEIARSGNHLDTGVNGYEGEFSHDVIGILSNMFTQGYFSDAHALLLDVRDVVGSQGQYDDGIWTYSWPWAIYLMKTGDLAFVKQNFDTAGPKGATSQPSIEDSVRDIATSRTGPGGIMEATNDIDSDGYWTVDDFEALMGLAAYRYLAGRLGDTTQVKWATSEYNALLSATNATLDSTTRRFDLNYLPCSMLEPNTTNRCSNPEDANWAAPFQFGKWAWDAQLFDAPVYGPGLDLIDSTYDYGFDRLKGKLPLDTFGGYPTDYFSTGYNAGYGTWGLASVNHRDQGILSYEFMIQNDQSGPYSWWESSTPPSPSPWTGTHPGTGQGASPHAWGISEANMVLLDSLVAQRSDGALIVGRGVPAQWLASGEDMSVSNFPTTDGRRLGIKISSSGSSVTLNVTGGTASGEILFELPSFVDNIAGTSSGSVDQKTGTVTLPASTTSVTVEFRQPPTQ